MSLPHREDAEDRDALDTLLAPPPRGRRGRPGLLAFVLAALALVLLGRRLGGRRGVTPLPVRAEEALRSATAAARSSAKTAAPVLAAGGRSAGRVAAAAGTMGLRNTLTTAALGTMAVQAASPVVARAAVSAGQAGRQGGSAAIAAADTAIGRVSWAADTAAGTVAERIDDVQHTWRSLMSKLTIALGLGVGYVLGTRAGRERYESIKNVAGQLMARPEVQQAQEKVKHVVSEKLPGAGERPAAGTTGVTGESGEYIDLDTGSDIGTHPERI